MILGFSTIFPKGKKVLSGRPTKFPEKIWQSFSDQFTLDNWEDYIDGFENIGYDFDVDAIGFAPKGHTIRQDSKNRWKVGMDIHFNINVRTKKMFRFAPILKVKHIQRISIFQVANVDTPYTYKSNSKTYQIQIDGQCVTKKVIEKIATYDGFDCVDDFFDWFSEDFTGKLIHWTDNKY